MTRQQARAATSTSASGSFGMPRTRRLIPALALIGALIAGHLLISPPRAAASTTQLSIIEDDPLMLLNPQATLLRFRSLGAHEVRMTLQWSKVAPKPTSSTRPKFNGNDPAGYPAANWSVYDTIVRQAAQDGIGVDFI